MQLKEVSSLAESVKELWDTCSIRGLIILSLFLQSFLILFAPLRRQMGGKWVWFVKIPLWIAYLLADWVAVFTIGLIMRAERSSMLALWSSFLLLHLGGPDTITSFSIEDNELWIRHLLGLLSRVGSSVYIILLSLSNDMLWLPTLLVLIAGIIKYAERNRAFYLASFDNFGNNWEQTNEHMPPIPVQFSKLARSWTPESISNHETREEKPSTPEQIAECSWHLRQFSDKWLNRMGLGSRDQENHQKGESTLKETTEEKPTSMVALYLLGVFKNLLVGPPLSSFENSLLPKDVHEMLEAIEIHLSLLYELLHTKFPVVDSKIGYGCRIVNLGCILGALVSFSLLEKHHSNKLWKFDIWLTYGLLIWALSLDLISIMLFISSDWITMAHFQNIRKSPQFIRKRRWSNSVPQLNILSTCHLRSDKERGLANNLFDIVGLTSLLEKIRRILWVNFELFKKDQEWQFIFTTLQEKKDEADQESKDYKQRIKPRIYSLIEDFEQEVVSSFDDFDSMESRVIMWHIVTEYYYQEGSGPRFSSASSSASNNIDHRRVCKLLSDYMFYLLVMEPTMIAVSPNSWKIVFEATDKDQKTLDWLIKKMKEKVNIGNISDHDITGKPVGSEGENGEVPIDGNSILRVKTVRDLVKALEKDGHRWEIMAKVWLMILCIAAISCQPIVHARQVSRGGQLLTLVWLLMNYMKFTLT